MRSTNPSRLERWLGEQETAALSRVMRGWYGPPIAVGGVPGAVYACGDGDFVGRCDAGEEAGALDMAADLIRRLRRAVSITADPRKRSQLNSGLASLAYLRGNGRCCRQVLPFEYVATGNTASTGFCSSAWTRGPVPAVGVIGDAAPGGRVPTSATAGAIPFLNAPSGKTTHIVGGAIQSFAAGEPSVFYTNLLYDRIFDVAKTMSSLTAEAVTGVPTRYQGTSMGDDYAGGNFVFPEPTSTLGSTAHNWTVCTYKNQGNADATIPSVAGISGAIGPRIDLPLQNWFMPLAAGDIGIKALTQMQCSASVTGTLDFVIGHPIAWFPSLVPRLVCDIGGLNTALNLARIFDGAALTFLSICASASSSFNAAPSGFIELAAG